MIPFIFLNGCGGDSPAVNSAALSPFVNHAEEKSCNRCHGEERPTREGHPDEGDCYDCHQYPSWAFKPPDDAKNKLFGSPQERMELKSFIDN